MSASSTSTFPKFCEIFLKTFRSSIIIISESHLLKHDKDTRVLAITLINSSNNIHDICRDKSTSQFYHDVLNLDTAAKLRNINTDTEERIAVLLLFCVY